MKNKKSICCGADLIDGVQCEACGADGVHEKKGNCKNCYLIYGEDGHLTCRTNHRAGTACLMDNVSH